MNTTKTPPYGQIRMLLTQELRDGLKVSPETLFFAESTYGITEKGLETALKDRFFEERQILINMLFFPTQKMRERVEPLLAIASPGGDTLRYLAEELAGEISDVQIQLPNDPPFSFAVSNETVNHLIEKLYMTRELDPDVAAVLDDQLPVQIATRLKVFMRCRNISFSEEGRRFLKVFVHKAADRKDDFEGLAELLLALTTHVPPRMTISQYLFEQREYQKQRLRDIEAFTQKTEQYGMEYLMMQNYPVPHESEERVAELLQKYTVIIEVLELQNPKERYLSRRDLGNFDTENDLQRLFKSLS